MAIAICRRSAVIFTVSLMVWGCSMVAPSAIANIRPSSPARLPVIGVASYYSYECAQKPMANGKAFDPEKRTCASWFYKFGTVLTVRSIDTGRATEVVVTDRGPNKRLVKDGRIIDLSKKAFEDICDLKQGLTRVQVIAKKPPAE